MKLRLTILTLFILGLTATTFAQQAKIEGYVSDNKDRRVSGVRIVVTPGGQAKTTDSKGHFIISLPDNIQPGQAAQIRVDRANWVIFNPMFGKCETKSAARNFEPLPVVIVPKGSPLSYEPKRLSEFVGELQKQITKQGKTISALRAVADKSERERGKYAFLQEYTEEYGLQPDKLKAALDEWSQIKKSDDKLERARKEYWRGNLETVTKLTGEAAPVYLEKLKRDNKQRRENSSKVISTYTLEGIAFFEQFKFREALGPFSTLEQLFESKELSKEEFTKDWAEVKLLIGNTKGELGIRVEGAEGPRLLAEALASYRQAETFYTRAQLPQQWAATQNNLGNVLSILGEQSEASESLQYLNQAVEAYRAALEVRTRAQSPQDWAMTQDNLGTAFRSLGLRSEGSESINYLNQALAAHHAALEVRSRAQFPQDWAMTQNNLGVILSDLGERSEGGESIKYLKESTTAYRAALEVFTRTQFPQQRAATQHNLGIILHDLSELVGESESLQYLKQAVEAYRAALEVRTRAQLPQQWAMTQNSLGIVLRSLGTRVEGSASIKYLNEAVAAYRAVLEVRTHAQFPQRWAATQNNLGVVLRFLGERSEGGESIQYLKQAVEAYRAALEVRTRAQLPQDWAMTQNNLGVVLRDLGERSEGGESTKYLNESAAAHRAALEVFTRTQFPQDWGSTQNNLGNVLSDLGERSEGGESLQYLNQAVEAYRAALEVGTRMQFPQQWAATQNNLASTYLLLRDWAGASEAYADVLQVYPDNEKAYRRAASLYHEVLFKFDLAFVLHQQWLARHGGDVATEIDFAETHFTTARFSECRQRIAALLARPELPVSTKTALRAIEIASLLALGDDSQVSGKLDVLIAEVSRQPADFKIEWSFNGTKYFIGHYEKLMPHRAWLGHLLDVLASEDLDKMLKALQEAQATFKSE